jgi:hypothetical protein
MSWSRAGFPACAPHDHHFPGGGGVLPGTGHQCLLRRLHDVKQKLAKGAHASVSCTTCHVTHEEYPHLEGIPKPVCANCHQRIGAEHARSIHGQELKKGNQAAPECSTCHGVAHEVKIAHSEAFRVAEPETCGMCHTDVADEYKRSVHYHAVARGVTQAPVWRDPVGHQPHAGVDAQDRAGRSNFRALL